MGNNGSPSRDRYVVACECGSTLKFSAIEDDEIEMWQEMWDSIHCGSGHMLVSCEESSRIRCNERARLRTLRMTDEERARKLKAKRKFYNENKDRINQARREWLRARRAS